MVSYRTPRSRAAGLGSAKEGTHHFWVQRVSAVANVTTQIHTALTAIVPVAGTRYLIAHGLKGARMWVTRFRTEVLKGRQAVQVTPGAAYWNVMRNHADLLVIDSPSGDRSQAALAVAPFMDQTVLVVAADQPDPKPAAMMRDAIGAAGGRCAGVFFNKVEAQPPRFLKRILP